MRDRGLAGQAPALRALRPLNSRPRVTARSPPRAPTSPPQPPRPHPPRPALRRGFSWALGLAAMTFFGKVAIGAALLIAGFFGWLVVRVLLLLRNGHGP